MAAPSAGGRWRALACALALLLGAARSLPAAVPSAHVCPVVLPLRHDSDAVRARVIDGRPSAYSDAMFHVSLSSPPASRVRRCTATRLSKRWILTAAHCRVSANWSVSLSAPSIYGGAPATIARVFAHPNYTDASQRRFDVAVIELNPPPLEPPHVPVVLLNAHSSLPADHAFVRVSGYGKSTRDEPSAATYGALRFADIPVYPFWRCRQSYARLQSVGTLQSTRQLCAGYQRGGCDACAGDSGGPLLQYDRRGRAVQVALVSAAYGCALRDYPGINARVDAVLPWLRALRVSFRTGEPVQLFRRGGIHAALGEGAAAELRASATPSPLPMAAFPQLTAAPGGGAEGGGDAHDDGLEAVAAASEAPTEEEEEEEEEEAAAAAQGGREEQATATASETVGEVADDEVVAAIEQRARVSDATVPVVAGVGAAVAALAALTLLLARR